MINIFSERFSNIESDIKRKCLDKIKDTKNDIFLSNPEEILIEYFYGEFELERIELGTEYTENFEFVLTLHIPVIGDINLLRYSPNSYTYQSSKTPTIRENEAVYEVKISSDVGLEQVNKEFESVVTIFKKNIDSLNSNIDAFNIQLKKLTNDEIKKRLNEIKNLSSVLSDLKIKLKRRGDSLKTYIAPIKRKNIVLKQLKLSKENGSQSEPELVESTYEEILGIIDNMSKVMERSPSVFVDIKEPDLRIHFLVQLNGQYEGEAMGEVFNLEGKTDIIIRHKGENIFIAECKIWDGKQTLLEAIDQLLNYVSWRDTKTAIILFNKNKDTTKVLEQIPSIVKGHKNYVNSNTYNKENAFRFIMKNKNDEDKHFILTIKIYVMPKA